MCISLGLPKLTLSRLMTDARFLCARLNALQGIDELGTVCSSSFVFIAYISLIVIDRYRKQPPS